MWHCNATHTLNFYQLVFCQVINKQLSELQSLQEERMDTNAELEEMLFNEISGFRDQVSCYGTSLYSK